MSHTVNWPDIPESVRINLISFLNFDFSLTEQQSLVEKLNNELAICRGYYTDSNTAVFENEEAYTWFLLKWSCNE